MELSRALFIFFFECRRPAEGLKVRQHLLGVLGGDGLDVSLENKKIPGVHEDVDPL
jgi:hypothetical protein